jgi:hypothetical protein
VADLLSDLVETVNAFALGDPQLMARDAARPGPKEYQQAIHGHSIIDAALRAASLNREITDKEAGEAIKEELANVMQSGNSLAERQSADIASSTFSNFVLALICRAYSRVRGILKSESDFAWKEYRGGGYKAMGAGTVTLAGTEWVGVTQVSKPFIEFVVRHADALKSYVMLTFQNPQLVEIINWIVRLAM